MVNRNPSMRLLKVELKIQESNVLNNKIQVSNRFAQKMVKTIPFSVDIGVDDVIVPGAVKRTVTTRLEGFKEKRTIDTWGEHSSYQRIECSWQSKFR